MEKLRFVRCFKKFLDACSFLLAFHLAVTLTGCAGRHNAQVLSNAIVDGARLHQKFDEKVYSGYSASLRKQLELLTRTKKADLESVRQRFLALGCDVLTNEFRAGIEKLDQGLTSTETAVYGPAKEKASALVTVVSKSPSDENKRALANAITELYKLANRSSQTRTSQIAAEVNARSTALQIWQDKVNAAIDDSLREIDSIESQSEGTLKDLDMQMARLQAHYQALLSGEEQVNEYLKQKSAVRLVLEGTLKGIGLDVSLSTIDAFGDSLLNRIDSRLNGTVDRASKKLQALQQRR